MTYLETGTIVLTAIFFWHLCSFLFTRLHMWRNDKNRMPIAPYPLASTDTDDRLEKLYDRAERMLDDASDNLKGGEDWKGADAS